MLLRQEGQSNSQVIETQKTSAVVILPDVGVYIIEVCAVSEGGDGTASPQIRVPSYAGKATFIFGRVADMTIIAKFIKKQTNLHYSLHDKNCSHSSLAVR